MKSEPLFQLTGGQDRSVFSLRADKANFYTMQNMRQARDQRGAIEQTPYFAQSSQPARGTYYDAGTQTEPAASAVRMIARIPGGTSVFQVTDYVIESTGGSQYQVFYQTTQPAAETIFTGCLLVINNVTGLGINLGSTLDVEMTATATFRWRKNGGGYTSGLVPSTAGVSIDGGNATLYFLANTGYAGTETWSWTRTDCSYDSLANVRTRPLPYVNNDRAVYFVNRNDRVMKFTSGSTSGTYAISVGYRAVYASYLRIFSDHLFLQDAGTSASSVLSRRHVMKNSDKSDYDSFIATDVNEADTNRLPVTSLDVQELTTGIGMAVINKYLYAFTSSEIFYTADLGLPLVTSFDRLGSRPQNVADATLAQNIVEGVNGVYILSDRRVSFFNGQSAQAISAPVRDILYPNSRLFGAFNVTYDELYVVDDSQTEKVILVYQAAYGTWHTRGATFGTTGTTGPSCFANNTDGTLMCGTGSRQIMLEDQLWGATGSVPVFDSAGTSWTTPLLITHTLSERLEKTKEITGTYLGVSSNYGLYNPSSDYATQTSRKCILSWRLDPTGGIGSTVVTDPLSYWVSTNPDGFISYPRGDYRGIALQITFVDANSVKPVAKCAITAIEPDLVVDGATR